MRPTALPTVIRAPSRGRRRPTVILANGTFPRKGGEPWRLLESAARVVACDGAADAFRRRFRRTPDFIVGDFDSLSRSLKEFARRPTSGLDPATPRCPTSGRSPSAARLPPPKLIPIAEQDDNDLAKAIRYCRERGWRELAIVGATGRREDHELGNIFRAMAAGIEVVTDHGRFVPFVNPDGDRQNSTRIRAQLELPPGTPLSVFATDRRTRMRSAGLEWPLDKVRFDNLYCATLNRTSSATVEISSNFAFFVYFAQ